VNAATSSSKVVENLLEARSLSELQQLMGPMTREELRLLDEARSLEPSNEESRVFDEDFVQRVSELTMFRLHAKETNKPSFRARLRTLIETH
jgi:hypothetical protein